MELRLLVSFLAVAEELHFGRAAARLHLAQPSLSQQIQRLERSVGVQLVERSSHQVNLTPAGEVLCDLARSIIAQTEEARSAVREVALGRAGTLRIGYNFAAGQRILPAALARMHAILPNVNINLVEQRTGPQLAALSSGALDVGLVYGRPASTEFHCRPMIQVPLVAVVGRGHSWARRSRTPFSELASQSCILFECQQCPAMYDAIHNAAERSGIKLNVEHQLDDPNATAIMVSVKPMVGFASSLRAGATPAAGYNQTVMVALHDPVPTVELCVVWRSDDTRPIVRSFLGCIESARPLESAMRMESGLVQ
ncbi:LysR family transcriptional regulator [Nocardia crassostreae]|uniref:LysR family transcriptional regulator n=1 Tax=Nocardia crassostreae TaxID=53428 RepID=UPI00082967F4|nr:LysR substrate-binding domain-containing protein [Nocardia crassostreae]